MSTPQITIPLIVNFCVAYLTASREVLLNIFNDPDAFVSDAAFLFVLVSVIVFIFGPGRVLGRRPYQEAVRHAAEEQNRNPRYGAQSGVHLLGYAAKCTRKQTQL